MRTPRLIALVMGLLLVLPGLSLLAGGSALGATDVRGREAGGYLSTQPGHLRSSTPALVSPALEFVVDPGTPGWVLDRLATDVRLTVSGPAAVPVFVGIARTADVDAYLAGVEHDEISTRSGTPTYRRIPADSATAAPSSGSWTVVLMNADGSPGVAGVVTPSVRSDALGPLALGLLVAGLLVTILAAAGIMVGLRGRRPPAPASSASSLPSTPALTR